VVYTYDGLQAKLFLNGHLIKSSFESVGYTPNSNNLFIGRHEDPANPYYFNGVIDEVRIYSRALPDSAAMQLSQ
jgi:hypothetical protein